MKLSLTRRTRGVLLGAALVLAAGEAGCGASLSKTVPPDLIQRLPKNTRRGVFQAETVVTIAVDRKANVKREIDNAEREIDRTKEKIREAEKRRAAAPGPEAEKIDLEIKMYQARIDYLDESLGHLAMRLKLADKELLLARSQFELEKVKLVKKHAISFDTPVEDFEEQVQDMQAEVDRYRKVVDEDAAELKREEEKWLEVKKAYFSTIGEGTKGWWTE